MIELASLRTAFMGTPAIAVPSLRVLAALTQLQLVVTQPDRPAGRGRQLQASPVKQTAEELGIPIFQPQSLRGDDGAFLAEIDLVIVLAYGELLREPLLQAPRLGCINLHASLLPRWRGASPLQAAIRAGDSETGVTVMRMVRGLDAGAMYNRRILPLGSDATLPWLHDTMAEESAAALGEFLQHHLASEPTEQDPERVTRCGKLQSADGQLLWSQTMEELDRQVRAYEPQPGCWALLPDGQRLRIRALHPAPEIADNLSAGQVAAIDGQLMVGCGDGCVAIKQLQPPGKKTMDAQSYLNGNQLPKFLR